MLFRNLVVYRLPADWSLSPVDLEEKLMGRRLQPCGPFEMASRGFVAVGPTERLLHRSGTQLLLTLGVEQKILPTSVIRQVAKERAAEVAAEQGFPVKRRQLRDITLKVGDELRARALCRRRTTHAWIDPGQGWFCVDAAGDARAEEVVEVLRDVLGSFAVTRLDTERSPQSQMAAWLLAGEAPGRFRIDDDLELKGLEKSKATIRYSRHPFVNAEVKRHLDQRLVVSRLGLTWHDRVAFVLDAKLQLRRLQFLGLEDEEAGSEEGPDDELTRFDAGFTLASGELAALLADLTSALGGASAQPAAAAAA